MKRMLRPMGDRVFVERIPDKVKSVGGIDIPDQAKEKPQEGLVVAVGEGRWESGGLIPMTVKVGDRVLFGKFVTELQIDGEKLVVLRVDELLAVEGEAERLATELGGIPEQIPSIRAGIDLPEGLL